MDLAEAGYLTVTRVGRRNSYRINPDLPMRHPHEADHTVGELPQCWRFDRTVRPSRLGELVPGVWLATAREYHTITTVLLDGAGGAVVVDPAWHPDELAAIPADLAALGVTCVAGVAAHEHYDHVLWHPHLGRVRG